MGSCKRTAQVRLKIGDVIHRHPHHHAAGLLSGLKGEIQNALGEPFVTQSPFYCRLGKLVVAVEIWIWVRFQNHDFIVGCQTQIDAAIAADAQRFRCPNACDRLCPTLL